jgi:6-phosphogluconolactonase
MSRGMRRSRRFGVAFLLGLAALMGPAATGAMADGSSGAVYTTTNSAAGNEVQLFHRDRNGSLTSAGAFATGGLGTSAGLGSQGALVLDGNRLFAVNAGSDSISAFRVHRGVLELVDIIPSGGDRPISVSVHGGVLYALNTGAGPNITGFKVSRRGELSILGGSTRPLSGPGADPAQVQFSPDGRLLVVTEKATNLIDVYSIDRRTGLASGPSSQTSAGQTPFGFAFDRRGHLIVSEAFGGATDASAVSSYEVRRGALEPVSPSAATTETAACWIVVTDNGRYAYTTNTGSASISGYRVSRDGMLRLLDADGRTGVTGPGPIDMALAAGSRFLYSLNSGDGTVSGFRLRADGGLSQIGGAGGLPEGASGLAAR